MGSTKLTWSKKTTIEIVYIFFSILAKTLRLEMSKSAQNFFGPTKESINGNKIGFFLFWHNRLLLVFLIMLRYRRQFDGFSVLVSANKDGDWFSLLLERSGYKTIRGSANKKSLQALKGIHKAIKQENIVGYAADGPTGPIYEFKPGAVFLSYKYKVPIHLIHLEANNSIRFPTWDKLILPLPFSKVNVKYAIVNTDSFNLKKTISGTMLPKQNLGKAVNILKKEMSLITGLKAGH